jgi:hypothetical protein
MPSPRIRIWKLEDAPQQLQSLHEGLEAPAWVALVPQSIGGRDLDDVIVQSAKNATVSRYNLPNGDTVYMGTPHLGQPSSVAAHVMRPKSARPNHR